LTWSQQYSVHTISKGFRIELKMEIKLRKLCNISQRLCEEVAALKGAKAHTLETTGLMASKELKFLIASYYQFPSNQD
jgi:hypothetical protein